MHCHVVIQYSRQRFSFDMHLALDDFQFRLRPACLHQLYRSPGQTPNAFDPVFDILCSLAFLLAHMRFMGGVGFRKLLNSCDMTQGVFPVFYLHRVFKRLHLRGE